MLLRMASGSGHRNFATNGHVVGFIGGAMARFGASWRSMIRNS